jgi:hypothetical protein
MPILKGMSPLPNRPRSAAGAWVVALAWVVAGGGCAGDEAVATDPVPASLTVVQGSNQAVQGGKELPNAIVLRVLTTDGRPVEGVAIGFTVMSGGGSVTPGSVTTDANGEGKAKWVLGPTAPEQTLKAAVAGVDPVTIAATAIVPTELIVAQGNNQTARVSTALPTAIVVRVVGNGNVPIVGVPVAFQITAGAGVITPQSALTNAFGEVSAKWTLGPTAGLNTLSASVGSAPPVTITATGAP